MRQHHDDSLTQSCQSVEAAAVDQVVYLHAGALAELENVVADRSATSIFLVVDKAASQNSGASPVLDHCLCNCQVTRFSDFEPNPKIEDVERGVREFRTVDPDLVIAFGGGTAIDLAKMIGSFASHDASARQLATGKVPMRNPGPALIAIPTTSGTGSEATHFAVVYVEGKKYSVAQPFLRPDVAIIDPSLTASLPPAMTIATGLDALCQAIESIWAVGATEESVRYAERAAEMAWQHLPAAAHHPTSEARLAMSRASHLAGKAINISKTTLPHAASYAITSQHGIPHGTAVAMTLSQTLAFNLEVTEQDCLDPRGPAEVKRRLGIVLDLLEASDVHEACDRIQAFLANLGTPGTLQQAGIESEEELKALASQVNPLRLSNNPRRPTPFDLIQILSGRGLNPK
ncbi:phosphonoacetaldehyde reductase [Rubinisphaera brasiliensis]|uniref:Alcohol dehydrogenase n=1 Tax=Rubinisphaera brasiliensis (strain ATCC 49424 / DSM 5305 / JCM 21570 / IAM 15109 / NBRC 103401 / IFAM 1448) TaxID=756272 RepID=F0STI7_RUBBR|nr:phosphonoacetaldehyde reductase [Rubinisphaera brasiliensis]ADY61456.1 Alcohol dehydrogenase [Rubinisphaera brasiliensis DSM 5305]